MSAPGHWTEIGIAIFFAGCWATFGLCMYCCQKIKKCRKGRRMDYVRQDAEGQDGSLIEDVPVENIEMVNVYVNNERQGRRNFYVP